MKIFVCIKQVPGTTQVEIDSTTGTLKRDGLIDEFVACIREHKTPLINPKWHRETIQSMLGCYESINTGKIAKIG